MTLHMKVYLPRGAEQGTPEFKPLRGDVYARLYADFKREMFAAQKKEGQRSFQMVSKSENSDKPVALQFVWKSDTTAVVIWARPVGEGQVPDLQALSVFLTRLDPPAEEAMLEKIKLNPNMAAVVPTAYEDAKNDPHPLAATFFVKEEAAKDSLIHALTTISAAAFFDQFGLADIANVVKLSFQGMMFLPAEAAEPLALLELALPEQEQQTLFREFNSAIKKGTGFKMTFSVTGDDRPITIGFSHVGQTAAWFLMTYEVDGDAKHIHGLTALLTKFDPGEDREAIENIRNFAALRGINPASFESPLKCEHPVVATFFADTGSANYPPLHSIIKILGAAFFAQFGIGSG